MAVFLGWEIKPSLAIKAGRIFHFSSFLSELLKETLIKSVLPVRIVTDLDEAVMHETIETINWESKIRKLTQNGINNQHDIVYKMPKKTRTVTLCYSER